MCRGVSTLGGPCVVQGVFFVFVGVWVKCVLFTRWCEAERGGQLSDVQAAGGWDCGLQEGSVWLQEFVTGVRGGLFFLGEMPENEAKSIVNIGYDQLQFDGVAVAVLPPPSYQWAAVSAGGKHQAEDEPSRVQRPLVHHQSACTMFATTDKSLRYA